MKQVLTGEVELISSRSDGSLKVVLGTSEMDSEQAGNLFQFRKKAVKILISDSNIDEKTESIIDRAEIPVEKKKHSASQRLRLAMLIFYKEKNDTDSGFEAWYQQEMSKQIVYYQNLTEELKENQNR